MALVSKIALLAAIATLVQCIRESDLDGDSLDLEAQGAKCGVEAAKPTGGVDQYFEKQRAKGIGNQCSKRDWCLLMRHMDMDYFERGVAGKLSKGTKAPPTWMSTGNCLNHNRGGVVKFVPVADVAECATLSNVKVSKVAIVDSDSQSQYPTGCLKITANTRTTVVFNEATTTVTTSTGNMNHVTGRTEKVQQLCVPSVAMDESSSFYYSPYKLKQNMLDRPQMSAACSFGQAPSLHRRTSSQCAQILAFRSKLPQKGYKNAQEALTQNGSNPEIKADVLSLEKKNKLLQRSQQWCTDVWNFATTGQNHCEADRAPSWARSDTAPKQGRDFKYALTEATCENIPDELFEDTVTLGEAPTDPFEKVWSK
mmetsp:Transcript_16756/g.37798  ORF Transcript_16756/g.37798 Transcript_16756/m.37798 type:complete len:368 (+) Transcript_16756:40-1143(+)